MASDQLQTVTLLIDEFKAGDESVLDELIALLYHDLRDQASRLLLGERPQHTLNTTALVHEAYVRLVGNLNLNFQNRAHFFGVAANCMRQILVEYARRRKAGKRGGDQVRIPIENLRHVFEAGDDILELDEMLGRLEEFDPRKARIVECRFFSGLSIEETAKALEVSPATVKRDWSLARAWLFRELGRQAS